MGSLSKLTDSLTHNVAARMTFYPENPTVS